MRWPCRRSSDHGLKTLARARARGVVVGAHPGFADREGFGRRLIPLTTTEIEQLVATQVEALLGAAALAATRIRYVKPHGALGNWAADDRPMADTIVRATKTISPGLAILAISGTELEIIGREAGLAVFSEVFADRGYLANGRLVPRKRGRSLDSRFRFAARRLIEFLSTGLMPTIEGASIAPEAHSICVHGDSDGALAMARHVRIELEAAGILVEPFLASSSSS